MSKLLITALLTTLGYFFGKFAESRHYSAIRQREERFRYFPMSSGRKLPTQASSCTSMSASVVLSDDYFKRIFASLKNLAGGRLTSYESLLDRARREATLRLKEKALKQGYKGVVDFQLETSNLFSEGAKRSLGTVQMIATGTAYR